MTLPNFFRSLFATRRTRPSNQRDRRRTFLSVQQLEDRLTPSANITITSAYLVDANDNPITTPITAGEQVYVGYTYTAQDLPANASYRFAATVNGETIYSPEETLGAGQATHTGQGWWGYFTATPGVNNVTMTIDPDHSVAEKTYADNSESFTFNASGPPTSWETYSVAQIRNAYGLNSMSSVDGVPADGTGQTIAIVDPYNDPYILSDTDGFDESMTLTLTSKQSLYQQYGPSSSFLTVYNEYGQNITGDIADSGANGVPEVAASDQGEITMDVEWAHAIAPGAKIDLIEADSYSGGDLAASEFLAASLPGVSAVSNSFDFAESEFGSSEPDYDFLFTTPAGHTGVTFLASSGDAGSNVYSNEIANESYYPSASPNVVSVGGTQLTLENDSYGSESGWSYATPAITVANGSSGYTESGTWTTQAGGFSGTMSTAAGGSSASATWTIPITSGELEEDWNDGGPELSATWTASPGNATNATYSVYDGVTGDLLGTVVVNQTQSPQGTADGASQFQELGVFTPTLDANGNGSLVVVLNANSANGTVDADAVGAALDWAGSGGPSSYEPEPSYQLGVQDTGFRTTPDVSFNASINSGVTCYETPEQDPSDYGLYYDYIGTSLGSPCWAGLIAIANQERVAAGGSTLNSPSNPQQTLQALYSLPASDYNDITTGYNGFEAGPGYDYVTGLGTPIANKLIPDLAGYAMTPAVTSVNASKGPIGGGETVTISGHNFLGASAVDFGSVAATSFTIVSSSEIEAVVPAQAAGAVNVTVTTPGGTSAAAHGDEFTYVPPPAVTGIKPGSGPSTGGSFVEIVGTNLAGATSVMFGNKPAVIVSDTSTWLVVIDPSESAGTVDVTVTTADGTSAKTTADQFVYTGEWPFFGGPDVDSDGSGNNKRDNQ